MTERAKVILTDADGTLVNWLDGFQKFMAKNGYVLRPNSGETYRISEKYDIPSPHATELVKMFNEGPEISELEVIPGTVEYVSKLVDLGFRFIVITSQSDAPIAKVYREKNLKGIFGDIFDEVNCITMGASKLEILKRWADTGYFWIEDHPDQADAGFDVGLKPVLIHYPHNTYANDPRYPIISNDNPWKQVYDIITKDYGI